MSTLHDRLVELADDAPPGGPLPGLWDRGRRIARRRRVGTAAIAAAACLALLVLAGLGWGSGRPASVGPAGGEHTPAMPDKLYEPSGWLGSFDGAPGTLAAVFATRRQHLTGSEPGIVGVSATTGRYGFLDLPDIADIADHEGSIALSADGRRLAYWITGETTQSPRTADGDPVTGFAVYDAVTGRTERVPLSTPHGLSADGLAWVDDDSLLFEHGQWQGGDGDSPDLQAMARPLAPMTWSAAGGLREVARRSAPDWVQYAGGHGWLAQTNNGKWRWVLHNLETGEIRRQGQPNLDFTLPGPAISPDGSYFAGIGTSEPGVLKIVGPGGDIAADTSEGTLAALYWLNDRQLLATRRVGPDVEAGSMLARYDSDTRRWTPLVAGLPPGNVHLQRFAFELLANPTRPAGGPPHPLGQRVILGSAVAIVLVSGVALVGWRRRVRP